LVGLLLVFALALYAAALLSGLASRTPLSASVLFLIVGILIGGGGLGIVNLPLDDPLVERFAQLALLTVLFVDGMQLNVGELIASRRLPARALLLGLPLTLMIIAVLARFVAGLAWPEAFLLGAVLSPTDPVFASALVRKRGISADLRHLLNIESGLNDGLALPIVLGMVAILWGDKPSVGKYALEVGVGVLVGVGVTWLAVKLRHMAGAQVTEAYKPLLAVAIGLTVYATSTLAHGNSFLAMFVAAITLGTSDPDTCHAFHPFGEKLVELAKLAALLLFGALLGFDFLRATDLRGYVLAVLILVLARPVGLGIALLRSSLTWRERLVAVWFGPRGFASVVYGMFVLGSGVARALDLANLAAIVIVLSILAHSSTDILAARWLQEAQPQDEAGSAGTAESSEAVISKKGGANGPEHRKEKQHVPVVRSSQAADEVER
jgi:sodium/hydrogen antiporter